jgi:threonine synthase
MCEKIKYISTNRSDIECSFQEALFKGLAFDRGLFMPSVIPKFSLDELKKFYSKTYEDIAIEVMYKFLKNQ